MQYDLKAELKKIGISQKEFSEIVKSHITTVSKWARNETPIPEWAIEFIKHYKKSKAFDEMALKFKELSEKQ